MRDAGAIAGEAGTERSLDAAMNNRPNLRASRVGDALYLTLLQEEVNHFATERNFVRAQVNICDSGRLGMTPALKGSAADAQKIANFLGCH
jgi:hypothetical protein